MGTWKFGKSRKMEQGSPRYNKLEKVLRQERGKTDVQEFRFWISIEPVAFQGYCQTHQLKKYL